MRRQKKWGSVFICCMALSLTVGSSIADPATVVTVVSGVVQLSKMFGSNTDYTAEVLMAVSKNVAKINSGLQVALLELRNIREEQARLPNNVFEHELFRNAAGRFQHVIELSDSNFRKNGPFDDWAYYRDIFDVYKSSRDARQLMLNGGYEVSEEAVFHLPLIFMTEAQSYHLLAPARKGLPVEPYRDFLINRGSWIAALQSYLDFYETALNPKHKGSLAEERDTTASAAIKMIEDKDSKILGDKSWDVYWSVCYSKYVKEEVFGTSRMTEDGHESEESTTYTYDFYRRDYYFAISHGEVVDASREDVLLETRRIWDTFMPKAVVEYFDGDQDCNIVTTSSDLARVDTLNGLDFDELKRLLIRKKLLEEINSMNEVAAYIIYQQAKIALRDEVDKLEKFAFLNKKFKEVK